MTDEGSEYFLHPAHGGSLDPPKAMWRHAGGRWEYFSTRDWTWQQPDPARGPSIPDPAWLTATTVQHASALERDRQRWVRYWAWHWPRLAGRPEDRPVAVLRRRISPEGRLDEVFTIDNRWERTPVIVEAESGRASNPPRLVAIDQVAAEEILQELRGVSGATEL